MKSMTIARLSVCVLAAAWMLPSGLASAQTVLLKPKFVAGAENYLELVQNVTTKIQGGQFGEASITMAVFQTFGVMEKVEAVSPETGTRLVMTFDRLRNNMRMPMGNVSFDSDVDDPADRSNPMGIVFGPMLGMPLTLELDKDQRVAACSGMGPILAKVEESAGGSRMLQQQRASLTDEVAKNNWGETQYILYPYREVKVGDTWKKTLRSPNPMGTFIFEYECQFKGMETVNGRSVARVVYSGTMRKEEAKEASPLGISLNLESGSFEGTAAFDPERGRFIRQDTAITMKLASAAPTGEAAGQTPAGMRLEMDLEVSRTLISIEERNVQRAANKKKGEELRKKAEAEEDAEFEADEKEAEEDITPENPVETKNQTENQNKDG